MCKTFLPTSPPPPPSWFSAVMITRRNFLRFICSFPSLRRRSEGGSAFPRQGANPASEEQDVVLGSPGGQGEAGAGAGKELRPGYLRRPKTVVERRLWRVIHREVGDIKVISKLYWFSRHSRPWK